MHRVLTAVELLIVAAATAAGCGSGDGPTITSTLSGMPSVTLLGPKLACQEQDNGMTRILDCKQGDPLGTGAGIDVQLDYAEPYAAKAAGTVLHEGMDLHVLGIAMGDHYQIWGIGEMESDWAGDFAVTIGERSATTSAILQGEIHTTMTANTQTAASVQFNMVPASLP